MVPGPAGGGGGAGEGWGRGVWAGAQLPPPALSPFAAGPGPAGGRGEACVAAACGRLGAELGVTVGRPF